MPNISEESLVSFMPSVAWTLYCSVKNVALPEWVHEDRAKRIPEFFQLLSKRDERAIDWVTEVAKNSEHGKSWLDLVQSLERYRWDESVWRQERVEAIVSLAVYCNDYPNDEASAKHLEGELRYWEDRYGELGFKSFDEWKNHWEHRLGSIEDYEDAKLFNEGNDLDIAS